jgi:broad specificity phosphatase PhoE
MTEPGCWPRELLLVRHAESAGNVASEAAEAAGTAWIDIAERDMDVALSACGEEQARAVGAWLASLGPDAPTVALASPYERAARTAQLALSSWPGAPQLVLDERLREREFGVLDRLTKAGIVARYPEEAEARARVGKFYYRPPGGESWCDVALRVRAAIDTVAREHRDERVLVVAHQVVILMFRYALERLTERDILAVDAQGELVNCSVTRFVADAGSPHMRLELFNSAIALDASRAPVTREPDVPVAPR